MARGIAIRNAFGYTIVDGERPHPTLLEEKTVTLAAGGGSFLERSFSFTPTPHRPTVVFHSQNAYIHVTALLRSGGMWNGVKYIVPESQPSRQIEVRVYDFHVPPSDSHGIEIYNSNGETVFTSSMRPFKLFADPVFVQMTYDGGGWLNLMPPSPSKPWVYMDTAGRLYANGGFAGAWHMPFLGPFEQDGDGNYYRFHIKGDIAVSSSPLTGGSTTWVMPLIVTL